MSTHETGVLQLTSTDALIVELLSRYDHAIFAGIKNRPTPEMPNATLRSWRYVGNEHIGVSLGHKMMQVCQANLDMQETSIEADEL